MTCWKWLSLPVRFDMQHIPVPESGCWLWLGSTRGSPTGHGHFRAFGKDDGAHRVAWMLSGKTIPDGMHVLHKCDTPLCVNPSHLFLGTNLDNIADRHRKGRTLAGEKCAHSKLTDKQAEEIRLSSGKSREVASRFGVSAGHVRRIRSKGSRS